ncbi:MAG TPA: MFS transporter [Bacteroides sp.]|nr:MFS transporter [Bacteroides sp.]
MTLSRDTSRHNYYSFLWHATFLALAQNFMDVDTILPAMLIEAGGNGIHVGFMTAIMLGGARLTQLLFAPFISNYSYKKKFLLIGINGRIISLLLMGLMLCFSNSLRGETRIWLIFILVAAFSMGGAFANVSYTDILGKSVLPSARKVFFSIKQAVTGSVLLLSALLARKVLIMKTFPVNYAWIFFIGFTALFVASLGIWNLKEKVPSKMPVNNLKHFWSLMTDELRRNKRLGYFLGWVNTMGISITLLPFVLLYSKQVFHTHSHETGLYLFYKVLGTVAIGVLLFLFSKKFKYRYLLYGNAMLALVVPLILLFSDAMPPFRFLFMAGGVVFAAYTISMNGVLLEISGNENRAIYSGIAGAGNMLTALFPLLGGWIIERSGFRLFFILFTFMILLSFFFVYKMNCRK